MLVEMVGQRLKVGLNLRWTLGGLHYGLVPPKTLWVVVYKILYGVIQKEGYYTHVRAMA